MLSTPPAFILSQDQTLRKKHKNDVQKSGQPHHKRAGKRPQAWSTSNPSRNPHTLTGIKACRQPPNKKYLVSTNKLGTLLSSQTTDTQESTPHKPTHNMREKKNNQDASLKSRYSHYHKLSKRTKPGKHPETVPCNPQQAPPRKAAI